jgi:hypothetical protein
VRPKPQRIRASFKWDVTAMMMGGEYISLFRQAETEAVAASSISRRGDSRAGKKTGRVARGSSRAGCVYA